MSVNPNTGALTGYAYASVGSWVNFSPTTVSGGTPVGVSINSQGEFIGWAYVSGINGGWMKFDCSDASTCIKTDWRPIQNRTGATTPPTQISSGSSGSSSSGSTPERRAADLASIWAYNSIASTTLPSLYTQTSVTISTHATALKNNDSGRGLISQTSQTDQIDQTSVGEISNTGTGAKNIGNNSNSDNNGSTTATSTSETSNQAENFFQYIFQHPILMIVGIVAAFLALIFISIKIIL